MILRFHIILLFVLFTSSVSGSNYYVSKEGDDQNSGTKEAPFLTIAKAATQLFAGDTCFIMEGIYREVLGLPRGGTALQPIVFKAFGTDSVLISATELVEDWMPHTGEIYKTPVSMSLGRQNMLYFDGQAMDWARWPNNEDGDPFTIDASPIEGGSASTVQDRDIPDLNWVGGYMWYLGAHSGTSWTREIKGYNSGADIISFDAVDINKWPFNPHNPTVLRNGNRGRIYLFGTMDALDYPGEWYFEDAVDTLYFQAPGNANPASHKMEVARRVNTIQLSVDYVHVDGINAFGGRVHITGDYCVIRNGTFQHCLEILDELNNTDAQMGNGAINIESSNNLIENNVIEYGSANGIAMLTSWKGSRNNTIHNNVIRHFNTIGIHSGLVRSNCVNTRVIGNTMYGTGRDGVYLSGSNSELAYNDIYGCMKINNDGGVFYTVGNQSSKNSSVHHNWVHDSYGPFYADGRAAGFYLDNDSKGYDVHHNVVWNVTWTAVQMNWDNWYNNIFNNSFWQVGGAMGNWLNGHELIDNKVYNNYSSLGPWIGNEFEANIIDPISPFNMVEDQDFTPKQNSVLIDQGVYIEGITTQVLGEAPDVGAYEYGISAWRPGVDRVLGGDTLSTLRIAFISPESEQVFAQPADVSVEVSNVNDDPGVKMSLYLDDGFLGTDSVAPFIWDPAEYPALSGLAAGVYSLKIQAFDMLGYAATATRSFSVVAGSIGDEFSLGNETHSDGTADPWTSNMVINKTDTYTNLTDSILYLQVGGFNFYAGNLADPITPFVASVEGENEFTILSIGDSRDSDQYTVGENAFPFKDRLDTILVLEPGKTIATGFLDAYPDGTGGGLGSVIPFNEADPVDALWYTGGTSPYQSGSVVEGAPPQFVVPPRNYYLRNYHFNMGFVIADSIQSGVGIPQESGDFSFKVYPNPVEGNSFRLDFSGTDLPVKITIYDLQGRMVYSGSFELKRIRVDSSRLSKPGSYMIRAKSGDKIVYAKLIKL